MIKNKNSLFFILLLSVLTACKVSRDIATPEAPLPVNFRNTISSDTTSIADIKWNSFFVEPSLIISIGIPKSGWLRLEAIGTFNANVFSILATRGFTGTIGLSFDLSKFRTINHP